MNVRMWISISIFFAFTVTAELSCSGKFKLHLSVYRYHKVWTSSSYYPYGRFFRISHL